MNVSDADFDVTDFRNLKPVAMLYQTGYLTIKDYIPGVLKVDKPAAIAMSQAEAKAYAAPYLAPGKPIWLVGISFERDTRKFLEGVYGALSDFTAPETVQEGEK